MIKNFRHKGLRELFINGSSSKVRQNFHSRVLRRLDVLEQCKSLIELNIPGFDFHPLLGKPKRYSVHVNGSYCITFGFESGHAVNVDLEDYH